MENDIIDKSSHYTRVTLVDQILWLIRIRWFVVVGIVAAGLIGSYIFPVLSSAVPIYFCAGTLLICNIAYFIAATKNVSDSGSKDTILAMIQAEVDIIILTAVLYFSGGVVNPFFVFYIFQVIIATIILSRDLSFIVGLTAILLFGLLAINGLEEGTLLEYYPLGLNLARGLLSNPVYLISAFVAFVFMVLGSQYLTKMVLVRMTATKLEAMRNNDLLKAVINAISEGLIFLTNDGDISICNPAAELWKDRNDKNESGNSFENFPHPLACILKNIVLSEYKDKFAGKKITFMTSGLEPRYVEAKSSPVVGNDNQRLGYVIVGQDLTEHKKLEKDLRDRTEEVTAINETLKKSRFEMAQREKMVAIGQMATGIAHEIGNPLASISSVAQYLVRRFKLHEQKEQLLVIQYHINRISNILKRMLSLSRPAKSEYKWSEINSLIDNTLSLINFDKRAKSVTIKNIPSFNLPMVWLNPQHFEQVLLNIFINSLDAINTKKDDNEHILKITKEFKNGMIEIQISDTGIGMSPEVCKRAFESFFTTKEIGKGTGLGLFISYNLVTEIDGTIELESELGKGTTVIIRIPLKPKNRLIIEDKSEYSFLKRA